ncbi:uncharacterized protein LOC127430905 [Myxocyprinus asiaticus]|uniref:uncharacterized protein LOC127430905 n=1 Tax=Myxocyprinus asiaticus TaxID=70543 RepID=UPI002221EC4D|nr:uncharacterized protein LOC127430905 [Myxocyprinus asiaticus]
MGSVLPEETAVLGKREREVEERCRNKQEEKAKKKKKRSVREQRAQRKKWRVAHKRSNARKKILKGLNTPPVNPESLVRPRTPVRPGSSVSSQPETSRQREHGRRKRRSAKAKLHRELQKLQDQLKKGAPDCVSGTLKRRADRLVSQGVDIPMALSLYQALSEVQSKVKLFYIEEQAVEDAVKEMPADIPAVPSTMRLHQVVILSPRKILSLHVLCNRESGV